MLTIACCRVNYVCVQHEVNFYIHIDYDPVFSAAPTVNSNATHTNPTPEHLMLYFYDKFRSFIRPSSIEDTVRPKHLVEK